MGTPDPRGRLRAGPRVVAVLIALLAACVAQVDLAVPPEPPLTILAASSLTESLTQVGAAWERLGHPAVTPSFDATSRIAKQVQAGAPADLFFGADVEWMDTLAGEGLVDPATRVDLLGNTLVVVVPAPSTARFTALSELADPAVRHLALAGENVPAGKYARAALRSADVWAQVQGRVVTGDNVRATLAWVAGGEAEAGIVYATDARVEPKVRVVLDVPSASHPPIVYPAAVVATSQHPSEAAAFLAFCRSDEARAIFAAAGFTAP